MIFLLTILALVSGEVHRCALPYLAENRFDRVRVRSSPAAARAVAQSLRSYQSRHFVFWWTTQSTDHDILGAPGNPLPSDSIPEMVRISAQALEMAWTIYVDSLGYQPPLATDRSEAWDQPVPEGKYPVEFCNVKVVLGDVNSTSKYFGGVDRKNATGSQSYMLLASDLVTFPQRSLRKDADGQILTFSYSTGWREALRATCVHELFHAVQFGYETNISAHGFFESSAVAMETRLVPDSDDYLQYAAELVDFSTVKPFPTGTNRESYAQGWQVRSLMDDLGVDCIRALWESRKSASPNRPSFLFTLREVLPQFHGTFDTQLVRHAVRLGLTGKRANWTVPQLKLFSDASEFPMLVRTLPRVRAITPLPLALGAVQVLIDTVVPTEDRLFVWVPDMGVEMGHAIRTVSGASVSWERGSVRYSAADASRSVWAFANPGNPSVLRMFATTESSISHYSMVPAPARTAAHAGQLLNWSSPDGLVVTGISRSEVMSTPLLHLDLWKPSVQKDPFAASVVAGVSGHSIVLEDADHRLVLSGAQLRLDDIQSRTAYIGSGDGNWRTVPVSNYGTGSLVALGELDLTSPVRILLGGNSAPSPSATLPRPNPSRGGEPVRFPLTGALGSEVLEILAADGGLVQEIKAQAGQIEVVWNLRNREGRSVRPGVYWYVWRGAVGAKQGRLLVAD